MESEKVDKNDELGNNWHKIMALGDKIGMSPRSGHVAHLFKN